MAWIAACLIFSGVSKSGSPAPNDIMSFPADFNYVDFLTTAIVGDGFILDKDSDSMLIKIF